MTQDELSNEGAWIVDPWANIACTAKDYSMLFRQKMNDWANRGKAVWFDEQWVKANNTQWLDSVLNGRFLIIDTDKNYFFKPFTVFGSS